MFRLPHEKDKNVDLTYSRCIRSESVVGDIVSIVEIVTVWSTNVGLGLSITIKWKYR